MLFSFYNYRNNSFIFHCRYRKDQDKNNFWIRAGTHVKNEGGTMHKISENVIHPEYEGEITSYNFDVALLKVCSPAL